jgi:predicted tellurium resistance membrane protein TerC
MARNGSTTDIENMSIVRELRQQQKKMKINLLFFEAAFPKGYVYVAIGFSLVVELLNIRARKKKQR